MAGEGTLNLASKALAGRVDISLSEALSAQAGRDLVRYTREGNRVVLPASIGGTLDRPQITIDAAAAVQRGLRNEIQRRLGDLLPIGSGGTRHPPSREGKSYRPTVRSRPQALIFGDQRTNLACHRNSR